MKMRLMSFLVVFICLSPIAVAMKTVTDQDTSGRIVEETIYEEGDNEYRYEKKRVIYDESGYRIRDERYILANDYNELGVRKTVKTFYREGGLKQIEILFRYGRAMVVGYDRILLSYDRRGTCRRMDVFFRDEHRDKHIYSHSSSFYDLSGTKSRTVYYFTRRLVETTGYHRVVETYNPSGEKTDETIFDVEGNVH